MIERSEPVTPAPVRFELKRSPPPEPMFEQPKPREKVRLALPPGTYGSEAAPQTDPVAKSRARRKRRSWMPFVVGSALVHAGILAGAAYVIVSHPSTRDIVPIETEEPTFVLDLRAMTTSIRHDHALPVPLPEDRSQASTPEDPTVDLVELPPLEIPPEPEDPIVDSTLEKPPLSGFAPPPASASSNVRLPSRPPSVVGGTPTGVVGGTGTPAPASGSPNGSPAAIPGGTGSSFGASDPPTIDSGLLHARHIERPRYPDASRQRGDQGAVTCKLTIDRDGDVIDVVVVESSGFAALDEEAVRALKHWRFKSLEDVTDSPRVVALQRLEFKLGRG